MRRLLFIGVALALIAAACGEGDGSERRVLVDFSSDEFASFALVNMPEKVVVRQGDTIDFRQTWTGEPHTVTGGSVVGEGLREGAAWIAFFEAFEALAQAGAPLPNPEAAGDATTADFAKAFTEAEPADVRDKGVRAWEELRSKGAPLPDLENPPPDMSFEALVELVETESEKALEGLPSAFTDEDTLAQNVSQPCYLRTGTPPDDEEKACAEKDQRQPEFDGKHSYYNSGVIPYEGNRGNTFRVDIADDAEPGSYLFYCAIHGFGQRSEIEIREADADIPRARDVARETRERTKEITEPLEKTYQEAEADLRTTVRGPEGEEVEIEGPFAGLPGEEHSGINEFLPKVIKAKVGEPITWKMVGSDHTISFDVPRYFPIMEFLDDGRVRINPRLQPAAGGAVPVPEQEGSGIVKHDGGTFDGTGFWSSGLIGAEPYLEYTMRISQRGTFRYACLLHPRMVGTVEVT